MVQARNLDNQKNAESNNRQTRHQADLKKISETVLKFVEKANAEGRLFASVNVAAIVRSIRKQVGVVVDEEDILLDQPIKNIGRQSVSIRIAGQTTQCIIDVQTKP
jgi:ribosomal protein L9